MNEPTQLHDKLDAILKILTQQQEQIDVLQRAVRNTSAPCFFCGITYIKNYGTEAYTISCYSCKASSYFNHQDELISYSLSFEIKHRSYQAHIDYGNSTTMVCSQASIFSDWKTIINLDYAVQDWTPQNIQTKVQNLLLFL